jgi:hypothetical protein
MSFQFQAPIAFSSRKMKPQPNILNDVVERKVDLGMDQTTDAGIGTKADLFDI